MKLTYENILNNIFTAFPMYHKIGSSAYKEGLENIEELVAIIGHPEKKFKAVHVTGTNGKGSVSHFLSSFFQEAGYKTGLYTSPHLIDFRERIKINGEMIPQDKVVDFFEQYQSQFSHLEPSFFEMTTALAFHYFAEEKVDIAIVEVGLGGRLDATNILTPELSVITNISLDHTQLLGDSLAKIAFEKAGIIKKQTPVVIGQTLSETMPVFEEQARIKEAPLYTTGSIRIEETDTPTAPQHRFIRIIKDNEIIGTDIPLPLRGDYQFENIATFVQAVSVIYPHNKLFNSLIYRALANVVANTHLLGRWQIISQTPLTICDTGHNSGGFHYISQQLVRIKCKKLHIIIGFVSDKDFQAIITLLPQNADYHICKANIARALDPHIIESPMRNHGLQTTISSQSVYQTYQQLVTTATNDEAFYIGGSTFIVADFLNESFSQKK